jgi:hypothetical protein
MRKFVFRYLFLLFAILPINSYAETLKEYVETCKSELGFSKLPTMVCEKDGLLFQSILPHGPIHDFVGYKRINDVVDYTFACRWALQAEAAGVEAIVYNRSNGKTCFFSAKFTLPLSKDEPDFLERVSQTIVSPTSSNAHAYWDTPAHVNKEVRCVNCHVAGPYIITKKIAPFMARFGLMNNGHDTMADPLRYHPVGSTFKQWSKIIQNNVGTLDPNDPLRNCANACHVLGGKSTQLRRKDSQGFFELQTSPNDSFIQDAFLNGSMPPLQSDSPYRWSNLDTPNASGEHETLKRVKEVYPHLACNSPKNIQAMAVGGEYIFSPHQFPDKLKAFNLRDGLVCEDKDQPGGKCHNYETRYKCDGEWTPWRDLDSNKNDKGDYESRSIFALKHGVSCPTPTDIQARILWPHGSTFVPALATYGPRDRLATFDKNKGLVCLNADQGSNQKCSNYSIRFICN